MPPPADRLAACVQAADFLDTQLDLLWHGLHAATVVDYHLSGKGEWEPHLASGMSPVERDRVATEIRRVLRGLRVLRVELGAVEVALRNERLT